MGWLRDRSALKIASLNAESEHPFDDALWKREQTERSAWHEESEMRRQALVAMALRELAIRGRAQRGRKATLMAYKVYKRQFLSRWASAVEGNAKLKSGKNQDEIAVAMGFTDASELRAMKRSDKKRDAMLWSRHPQFITRLCKKGWYRRGSLVHLWMLDRLMSPGEFEEWAKKNGIAPKLLHQGS